MYVLHINDLPLTLAARAPTTTEARLQGRVVENPDEIALRSAVAALEAGVLRGIWLHTDNAEALFNRLNLVFRTIYSAGGLVLSDKGRLMMIRRYGNWEFPKGKLEKGETPEEAAVREVMEECGVKNLTLGRYLSDTLHTYRAAGGRRMLKVTHWFVMSIGAEQRGRPQREEGIAEVAWVTPEQARKRLTQSYRSVRGLVDLLEHGERRPTPSL